MKNYALTYWFTWAFLVVAAAFTGVASLKDAFFDGLFAALLSASLARVYARAGLRYAPFVGAAAGIFWVVAMFYRIRFFGYPEDFERAQWTLGTDISVHVAGFAGAGLLTALRVRYSFEKSLAGGLGLAVAMTAIPYGVIAWVDHQVAGPIEVVLLVSAEAPADQGPPRRVGAVQAILKPMESTFLKDHFLVSVGPGGEEVMDDQGRRFWPLWRRRLVYPGNPGGPVRTLLLLLPPNLLTAESWTVPVHQAPDGVSFAALGPQQSLRSEGTPLSQSVQLAVSLKLTRKAGQLINQNLEIVTERQSPFGEMYAQVSTLGLSAAFAPLTLMTEAPGAKLDPKVQQMRRPNFSTPEPASK